MSQQVNFFGSVNIPFNAALIFGICFSITYIYVGGFKSIINTFLSKLLKKKILF